MTDQPEQLISHGREIAMTATEKMSMRHMLLAYTSSYHSRVTATTVAWSWVRRHSAVSVALAALLVLGGTGVSASMAGPNDALYSFRLQVNDRIEEALTFNEDAQIDVELRQIERQINAETGAVDELVVQEAEDEVLENKQQEKFNQPTLARKEKQIREKL